MRFCFTAEHIEFLRGGYQQMRIPALTAAFNKKFGLDKTEGSIKAALKNRRITCGRKPGFAKGEFFHKYTREQADFIGATYPLMPLAELTKAFNIKFGTEMSESSLRAFTRNHKIRSGRTGQFDKGHVPFNAGTKGVMKPNSGSFKKGDVPGNIRPLGSERICSKDGYVLVKIAQENPHTGHKTRFHLKHIVEWEKENGPLPEGMILRFLDGDKINTDPSNLVPVNRAEHLRLTNMGFNELPAEVKPVALTLARVEAKTFQLKKKS